MNRLEIRQRFRSENPEITDRVLTDATLNSWMIEANINFCCATRLIQKSGSFTTVEDQDEYELTSQLSGFYEIDEFPGGGVAYDGNRLTLTTKAALDNSIKSWRSRSSGTPTKYYRRANYLYFDRPSDEAVTVDVDYASIPDSFDDDTKSPYNELLHLEPYHYGIILYLQGRAKMAVGKDNDKTRSMAEYLAYVEWCKKQTQGGKLAKIQFINNDNAGAFVSGFNS